MMSFFLFWVAVAAAFLNPAPAAAGTILGIVGGFGRLKIAFAMGGPALVLLTLVTYLQNPSTQFSDLAYWVAVQFCSMVVWSLFVGAVTMTAQEAVPMKVSEYLSRIRAG